MFGRILEGWSAVREKHPALCRRARIGTWIALAILAAPVVLLFLIDVLWYVAILF